MTTTNKTSFATMASVKTEVKKEFMKKEVQEDDEESEEMFVDWSDDEELPTVVVEHLLAPKERIPG